MSSSWLLGLDVGTTSIKAVVYDPGRGKVRGVASQPTPVLHPRPQWAEWDPEALWGAVVHAVREAVAFLPQPASVAALGIASVGEAGLALDDHGRPLRPIIAWFDPRGEEYVGSWTPLEDPRRLYAITGHFPRNLYTAFKLLWLREHEPEVWARLAHWLFVGDYIVHRMTGEMATVPTLAARSFLYDVVRRTWSAPLLDALGLREGVMPPVRPAAEPVGRLRAEAARQLGLPVGIPVALAGHDHVVGMWLAGITQPGRAVDSSGTAQSVAVELPAFIGDAGYEAQLTCYPMVVGDTYILQGGMPTAGAALQWLADLVADGRVETLLSWAEQAEPGSRGMGVIPFLRGPGPPYRRADLRGIFYQVDLAVGRAEMARALVEGLACFLADVVGLLERVSGRPVAEVRAIGGTNRHPLMLQVKAAVLNRPVTRVDVPEAVGTGAALLGGLAAGLFASPAEALGNIRIQETPFQPDPAQAALYREVFRRYQAWMRAALSGGESAG